MASVAEHHDERAGDYGRRAEGVSFADWGVAAADGAVCDGWEGVSGD